VEEDTRLTSTEMKIEAKEVIVMEAMVVATATAIIIIMHTAMSIVTAIVITIGAIHLIVMVATVVERVVNDVYRLAKIIPGM